MIINVGGRTDIVNYYTPWLIKRLNEGYVYTRNPYNSKQVTKYSLTPDKVDVILFCSKNYQPILEYMPEIMKRYPVYCYYTITCYEDDVEKRVPNMDESIQILSKLSVITGKDRLSWRYDPILLTEKYTVDYHLEKFEYLTSKIYDKISLCVFSFVDMYSKVYRNMPEITEITKDDKKELLNGLSTIAERYDMPIQTCGLDEDYTLLGIRNSGCITTDILEKANSITFKNIKPRGKRQGCTCIPWNDIGEYDTCLNECKYCYANKRPNIAMRKYKLHNPDSPILIGQIENDDIVHVAKQKSFLKIDSKQQRLI